MLTIFTNGIDTWVVAVICMELRIACAIHR